MQRGMRLKGAVERCGAGQQRKFVSYNRFLAKLAPCAASAELETCTVFHYTKQVVLGTVGHVHYVGQQRTNASVGS